MGHRLLIVDDSSSMRLVLRKVVQMSGFPVESFLMAGSGREALEVLAANPVDLVLSDINMPVMTGMELLAKMKADPRLSGVPVIVVSTEGSEERQNEARRLGAAGYLKKPFQPEDVRVLLENCLGGSK